MHLSAYDPNWPQQYHAERLRLLETLGLILDGGFIESIAHVGATSVPGLSGASCIDIALTILPYPITEAQDTQLNKLGYHIVDSADPQKETCYLHQSGRFQLWCCRAGNSPWHDHVLLRDYLSHNEFARLAYMAERHNAAPDKDKAIKQQMLPTLLANAHQWWINRIDFAPVKAVQKELAGLAHPWYISSGWAADLFLGKVTRYHHDVDVVVPWQAQLALQSHLIKRGWRWLTPLNGKLEPWPPHMRIELPRHQAHAHRDGEFIDFLFTDFSNGCWLYRRDPQILRSLARMSLTSDSGIPYLAPELILLFKSKNTGMHERPQDQEDFAKLHPHLDAERRAWLRWALTAADAENPWLGML